MQSTLGAVMGARQERAALRSQARIAEINAGLLADRASQAVYDGKTMASRRLMEGERLRSAQAAAMGANGIVVGEGSSARVLASTDYATEVDARQIEANAIRQALGLRIEAYNQQNEAAAARVQRAGISPFAEGASTFLTGATSVAASYRKLKEAGALTKPGAKVTLKKTAASG